MFFGPGDAHWDLPDELDERPWGHGSYSESPNPRTCRRCGCSGLYWAPTVVKWKWVLVDIYNKRHVCDKLAVAQMEFGCNEQQ